MQASRVKMNIADQPRPDFEEANQCMEVRRLGTVCRIFVQLQFHRRHIDVLQFMEARQYHCGTNYETIKVDKTFTQRGFLAVITDPR